MILLRANEELKQTFDRMIAAMKAPVAWNGIFAVIDDYIILQGEVRSLFFHFDTKKVTTNIIDIPVEESLVSQVADNICLQNTINMILYVFGKWGAIEGIKVNKDVAELNRLFTGILHELAIEPDYTWDHFRFYQGGIRITYEDVVSQALLREENALAGEDGTPAGGLWRKIVWKRRQIRIARDDAAANAPQSEARLGHNFYVTAYLCPVCGSRLHMVVYPEGRETRIETDEGGVMLARACTCSRCQSFYTPRPGRLIGEGDVYLMEFADDTPAYEDYMGLLGRKGQKTSNYNYNEFVDPKKREEQRKERETESLEEVCGNLPELPEEELEKVVARMEEGFYPEESIEKYGDRIREQYRNPGSAGQPDGEEGPEPSSGADRAQGTSDGGADQAQGTPDGGAGRGGNGARDPGYPGGAYDRAAAGGHSAAQGGRESAAGSRLAGQDAQSAAAGGQYAGQGSGGRLAGQDAQSGTAGGRSAAPDSAAGGRYASRSEQDGTTEGRPAARGGRESAAGSRSAGQDMSADAARGGRESAAGEYGGSAVSKAAGSGSPDTASRTAETAEQERTRQKYEARMQMLDRYSERQLRELKNQLERETLLLPEDRDSFLARVSERLAAGLIASLTKKVDACADKNYAVMKRVFDEIGDSALDPAQKAPLLERMDGMMQRQASAEVGQLVLKIPPNLDRAHYKNYLERIRSYEGVDLTPYEEQLNRSREASERQELANLVRRSRKLSREDLTGLIQKLEDGDFLPELVSPYVEKTKEKIRQIDTARIEELCPDLLKMTFDEAMEAYEKIQAEDFLPELKEDTLRSLKKRLSKLKSDECELLVQKLQAEFSSAGIHENPRHHFYPARKVMLKQATKQETEIFDYAMACYAADRGLFEYPILVVDTARSQNGKEGIILTPDHLFYSTMLNAYGIPVASIESIRASSGLLNKGVTVLQKNGTKTKLPYAVDAKELTAYAEVLDDFVHYLQEKPDSRKVTYLAKEHHDRICCFRCGCEYKGGTICPKCGYQNNG